MSQILIKEIFDDAFGAGWDDDPVHGPSLNALYDLFTGGEDFLDIYALLAGRAGGQTLYGGTGAGDNLSLQSTSHATRGHVDIGCGVRFCETDTTIATGSSIDFSPAATLVASGGGVVHNVFDVAPVVDVETTVFVYSDFYANGKFNQKAATTFSSFIGVNATPELYSEDASYNPLSSAMFRAAPETSCRVGGDVGTVALVTGLVFSPLTDSRLDGSDMTITNITAVDCAPLYQTRHANAAFTVDTVRGLWCRDPVKQLAGQDLGTETYTDYVGLDFDNVAKPVNTYVVRSALAAGANNWFLYNSGGATSYLNGKLGIGTDTPATPLHVLGTSTFHGNGAASLAWGNTTNLGALSFSGSDVVMRSIITDADFIFQRNNTTEVLRLDGATGTATFVNRVNSPSHSILTKYIECEVYTSAGVNACLAELGADGGHVHVPEGTVVCTETISIPFNNITLSGAGKGTIFDASGGQAFHVIDVGATDGCVIKDLQIIGNAGEVGGWHLVTTNGSTNLTVKDCYLSTPDNYAVEVAGANNILVTHNQFTLVGAGTNAVHVGSSTRVKISENTVMSGGQAITTSATASHVKIINNQIYDTIGAGILSGGDWVQIRGNLVYSPATGIYVYLGALNCSVMANDIWDAANNGSDIIITGASHHARVIGNDCYGVAGHSERAIYLADGDDCIIQGNYSEGHDTAGIQIDAASTNASIGGNILNDTVPMIDNGSLQLYEIFGRLVAGGVTDNFEVEDDGTIVFHGAATAWDDIQFDTDSGRVPAANAPTWEALTTNTSAYSFSVDDYKDLLCNEYSHAYEEGGTANMHAHVTLKTAQAAGADRFVKLQVWLSYVNRENDTWSESTLSAELTVPTGSSALQAFYLDLGDVDLSGYLIGSQMKARIARIAATGGTEYADDVYITQVGAHLEKDTVGSRTEIVK